MTAPNATPSAPALDANAAATARQIIFFTVFLDILGFGIIIPQLQVYATQFGATPLVAGFLASTYSAMGFLFMPFWGRLSDRIGRRPVLLYSIFGTGIGYLLFAFASSLPFLFAARTIDGITGANISTAQAYISDITKPEERSKYFAIFGAIFGIGFAIGPAIGWGLSHLPGAWGGNLGLGAFSAALSFLNWALAIKFLPETLHGDIRQKNQDRYAKGGSDYFNTVAFSRALGTKNLNVIIVIGFLATTAFATLQGTYALFIIKQYVRPAVQTQIKADPKGSGKQALQLLLTEHETKGAIVGTEEAPGGPADASGTQPYPKTLGGDFDLPGENAPDGLSWRHVEKLLVRPQAARSVGVIFAVIGFLSILIQGGLVRKLPKRMGEVNMVLAGTFIMAIGLALIPLPHHFNGQFFGIAVLTLGNGLCTPVLSSLVSQLSPEAERGEVLGVFQSLQSLGRIVGPVIGASFFNFVAAGAPFIAGALIMSSSCLLALKLRKIDLTSVQNYGVPEAPPKGAPLAEPQ